MHKIKRRPQNLSLHIFRNLYLLCSNCNLLEVLTLWILDKRKAVIFNALKQNVSEFHTDITNQWRRVLNNQICKKISENKGICQVRKFGLEL